MTPKEARLLLSDREWQVAERASRGKKIKEIARELNLSEGTIKRYLFSAKKKLGKNFRNYNLFGSRDSLSLNAPEDGNAKKLCGKELLEYDMRTGKVSMAFKRYAMGEVIMSSEARLAYAISGLGDRNYLFKKRAEALKTLSQSARYKKIAKLSRSMHTEAVREIIALYKLRVVKKELAEEDETEYYYLCTTDKEFNVLMGAVVGFPNIKYCEDVGELVVEYNRAVFVEYIRVKPQAGAKWGECLAHEKYLSSKKKFTLKARLQSGSEYMVSVMLGNGAHLNYDFVVR